MGRTNTRDSDNAGILIDHEDIVLVCVRYFLLRRVRCENECIYEPMRGS